MRTTEKTIQKLFNMESIHEERKLTEAEKVTLVTFIRQHTLPEVQGYIGSSIIDWKKVDEVMNSDYADDSKRRNIPYEAIDLLFTEEMRKRFGGYYSFFQFFHRSWDEDHIEYNRKLVTSLKFHLPSYHHNFNPFGLSDTILNDPMIDLSSYGFLKMDGIEFKGLFDLLNNELLLELSTQLSNKKRIMVIN